MKILFYPRGPRQQNKIMQICEYLKLEITNDIQLAHLALEPVDVAINWRGAALHTRWQELQEAEEAGIRVINSRCNNLTKEYVDEIFLSIFNYSSLVNPLQNEDEEWKGPDQCVEKSNRQAAHDGRIITLPIKKTRPDHIYQKLINNQVDEDLYRDIRIPVFGKRIPMIFFKNKDVSIRFTGISSTAHVIWPSEFNYFFPGDVLEKCIKFCNQIGMQYGELDLLYCKDEKKYYIIDANKTPGNGIFKMFQRELRDEIIRIMAETFKEEFLS